MPTTPKILIVDDDPRIRNLLREYLDNHGFISIGVADGVEMLKTLNRQFISLIVLDLNLPGQDGLALCRQLRDSAIFIPIIMLTARCEEVDRIIGLEFGADDYLPKPFNPRELLARIRAILRRAGYTQGQNPDSNQHSYIFGCFHLTQTSLRHIDDNRTIGLNNMELSLLLLLAKNAGQVVSRDQISIQLKGQELLPDQRSIDMIVSRLRKYLKEDPYEPHYLRTVRGIGYLLVVDETLPV